MATSEGENQAERTKIERAGDKETKALKSISNCKKVQEAGITERENES